MLNNRLDRTVETVSEQEDSWRNYAVGTKRVNKTEKEGEKVKSYRK